MHASGNENCKAKLEWIYSDRIEEIGPEKLLEGFHGIVVPGGFGQRDIEGIYLGIKYARENKIPYLGLCYGMQLAAVEYARNVCHISGANTTEIDRKTKHPIIDIMKKQQRKLLKKEYGATMRLGAWDCDLKKGTIVYEAYGEEKISERHRHRYEFNSKYKKEMEGKGMVFSGLSPYGDIVEIIELPEDIHPFFVGVQFHPEFKSRPLNPHPLFKAFIKKCLLESLMCQP